jgi:ATP-dependent Lon protease
VILPRENESDLEELPTDAREAMEFVLADELPQVLAAALDGKAPTRVRRAQSTERRAALGR